MRALLFFPFLLGACQPDGSSLAAPRAVGTPSTTPRQGGVIRYSIVGDVATLDPALAYDEYSIYAGDYLYDTLLGYSEATAPDPTALLPQLAESYTVSNDGRVYTFHLRPGVTFSDGQPLVAEDFVYTLTRVLNPDVASPGAQFLSGIVGAPEFLEKKAEQVSGLRALDARTLEITLAQPDASFPLILAMKFATPLKRAWVESVGDELRHRPLGTGPFVLERWNDGVSISFARNLRYWDRGRPYLDGVHVDLMKPRDVAMLKFLSGEYDTVDRLSSDLYLPFAASKEWAPYIMRWPQMNVYAERLDVEVPPFDDKRVRQAMNYALNKEDAVLLQNGRAIMSHGVLPPLMPGYDPDLRGYPYDPEKAKQLLAAAGYPDGFSCTYYTTTDELAQKLAQSLQADLRRVGIKMDIQLMSPPVLWPAITFRKVPFSFTGWQMDFPDPWNFLEVRFHSRMINPGGYSNNDSGYRNPIVDALLDVARGETEHAVRLMLYRTAERIIVDDAPWIFHYHGVGVEVRQPYVMNYRPHPVWIRSYRDTWLDRP